MGPRSGLLPALMLAGTALTAQPPPEEASRGAQAEGVIVEEVTPGSAGYAAGLRPGDLVERWSRTGPPANPEPVGGFVQTEFELLEVATEQGPRGEVALSGRRGAERLRWVLPTRRWGLKARPVLAEPLATLYQQGLDELRAGNFEALEQRWGRAALETTDVGLAAWFLARSASASRAAGRWPQAEAAYREACARAESARETALAAHLHREWARDLLRQSRAAEAQEHLRRSLELASGRPSPSLDEAATRFSLGFAASLTGELAAAEQELTRSLEIREQLAPRSYVVALLLNTLGELASRQSRFDSALDLLARAVALHRRVAPPGPDLAGALVNLGHVQDSTGDPAAARASFTEAIAICDQTSPRGDTKARALSGLAAVDMARGDLGAAESGLTEALEIWKAIGGEPVNLAKATSGLPTHTTGPRSSSTATGDDGGFGKAMLRFDATIGAIEKPR